MSAYMLDTNICSYVLRRRPADVARKFRRNAVRGIAISEIVLAELMYGAERHATRGESIREDIDDMVSRLDVLPWNASEQYGYLRAHLERKGKPMGAMDLLIAAHALAEQAILVTHDGGFFNGIPGLLVERWA